MTELESAHAAIAHLRATLGKIVEMATFTSWGCHRLMHSTTDCRCIFCSGKHAMSSTSGYAEHDWDKQE